jgi:hypothetical protein
VQVPSVIAEKVRSLYKCIEPSGLSGPLGVSNLDREQPHDGPPCNQLSPAEGFCGYPILLPEGYSHELPESGSYGDA